jgi:hypothetical protein
LAQENVGQKDHSFKKGDLIVHIRLSTQEPLNPFRGSWSTLVRSEDDDDRQLDQVGHGHAEAVVEDRSPPVHFRLDILPFIVIPSPLLLLLLLLLATCV